MGARTVYLLVSQSVSQSVITEQLLGNIVPNCSIKDFIQKTFLGIPTFSNSNIFIFFITSISVDGSSLGEWEKGRSQ